MNDESVSFIAGNTFSKLLERPFRSRVSSDIKVKDAPSFDFHDDENVDQLERCRYNNEEVSGNDGFGVIAHERHPSLTRVRRALRRLRHVTLNCAPRNLDTDLQQQFIGNSLLALGRIVRRHLDDQFPRLGGDARSVGASIQTIVGGDITLFTKSVKL